MLIFSLFCEIRKKLLHRRRHSDWPRVGFVNTAE